MEALRAEIDELRYEVQTISKLYGTALIRLKSAIESLAAEPGSPHAGAAAALEALYAEV